MLKKIRIIDIVGPMTVATGITAAGHLAPDSIAHAHFTSTGIPVIWAWQTGGAVVATILLWTVTHLIERLRGN